MLSVAHISQPGRLLNPFPAKPFTLLILFSSKSSLKEMLKRLEMFILRTQCRFRMYQKLEFALEVSIQHPIAAYKLRTVYFGPDLIWRPKGRKRVNGGRVVWPQRYPTGHGNNINHFRIATRFSCYTGHHYKTNTGILRLSWCSQSPFFKDGN